MLLFTPRPVTIKLLFYRLFTIIFIEVVILEYRPHRLSAEYLSHFAGMIFLTNSGLLLPKYLSEEVFMIYKRKRIVVALGGNALGNTLPEQMIAVKSTAKALCDLIEEGHQVVVVHGNGPQVGMINNAMAALSREDANQPNTPLSVCVAMSQAYIGYDLQNAIRAELMKEGIYKPVSTILTQVTVDTYDEAFAEPVKVIGRVLNEQEAEEEENKGNYVTKIGDGYRRIVAAPKPQKIVEIDAIRALLDAGQIVIACGGGGIPVLAQGVELHGASAVIEKDYASGRMAELLNADVFMVLTSVENVCVGYNTEQESPLEHITVAEAQKYIDEGQFEPNTMLPKIEAGVSFLEKGNGRKVIITSIDKALEGYLEKTGTIIE